jgi:carbamate kinase
MRIVVALGGNALIQRGGPADFAEQQRNVARAAVAIAAIAPGNEVVITHGNGPQIGMLALLDASAPESQRATLDILGAETDGMIGYLLERELMNALGHPLVATLLTQVEVDPEDPAFDKPTKFIGPGYSQADAHRLAAERGWSIARDGERWRRVVASPKPLHIIEHEAVEHLLHAGFVTVCVGGGGIPVIRDDDGLKGAECVVDKDLASALLAENIRADTLLMLTDVDGVYRNFGRPDAERIRRVSPNALRSHAFPAGSMGPKVEAACRFARIPGARAYIGSLGSVAETFSGNSGTLITLEDQGPSVVR